MTKSPRRQPRLRVRRPVLGDGRVKVLDFGLAEFSDREGTRRTIGGTPTYMAPEQWAAYPATGASDVWSLGVILYEMATGQRLFRAEEGDDMAAIRQQICAPEAIDVRPLGAAGMPEALVALVARCLAKRADVRPTAAEVDDALMPLQLEVTIASVPSLTPPPSSVQPVAARSGRRWWLPAGAVAGVLLVVALFFVLTRDGEPAVDDEGPAPAPVARAEHAGDVGEAAADATPEDDPGAADEKGHDGDGDGSAPEVGNPPAGPRPAPRADEASKTPDTPGGADPKKEPEPKEPWDPMSYR